MDVMCDLILKEREKIQSLELFTGIGTS